MAKEAATMREASRVKRLLVEDGPAVGVETVGGHTDRARRAVVSGIGLNDTFLYVRTSHFSSIIFS